MAKKNELKISDLKYTYSDQSGSVEVLKGVNAEFRAGKLYAIVGESGSGKTTLLSLLAGLDKLQEGGIEFNGKSIAEIGQARYRLKNVNVVFQSFNLIKYMTARENVEVALDFAEKPSREAAYKALELMGLNRDEADRLVLKLSGGQQQRVAIARALASNVPIIVADEPTGNLDEETEEKVVEIFRRLAHEDNRIVIIVTHSRRVASVADIVYRLKGGVLSTTK